MSNSKEKAPINWHLTCQLTGIYEKFKEQRFRNIQSTRWLCDNPDPDSHDKNVLKVKVNDLVRLHKTMQEKLKTASYSEQIQILTLVHDTCRECTVQNVLMSLNTLFELHIKSKKSRWNISKTCAYKKKKLSPLKHIIW